MASIKKIEKNVCISEDPEDTKDSIGMKPWGVFIPYHNHWQTNRFLHHQKCYWHRNKTAQFENLNTVSNLNSVPFSSTPFQTECLEITMAIYNLASSMKQLYEVIYWVAHIYWVN